MNSNRKSDAAFLIHSAAAAASAIGGGMAQLPIADSAALVPLQISMVIGIADLYDKEITDGIARGLVLSMAAGWAGRAVSQVLIGWIPGVGNLINAATAGALTEAIGWLAYDRLEKGLPL